MLEWIVGYGDGESEKWIAGSRSDWRFLICRCVCVCGVCVCGVCVCVCMFWCV
jgi:hypothetical protein